MSRVYFDVAVDDEYEGRVTWELDNLHSASKFTNQVGNLNSTTLKMEQSFIVLDLQNLEFTQTILEKEEQTYSNTEIGLLITNNEKYYITTEPFSHDPKYQVMIVL